MVKPVKHAEQFAPAWERVKHQKGVNEREQNKILKTAFKIFKEEVKYDPFDARENLGRMFGTNRNDSKAYKALMKSAQEITDKSIASRDKRIADLKSDLEAIFGIPVDVDPPLFFLLKLKEAFLLTDDQKLLKKAPQIREKMAELQYLTASKGVTDNWVSNYWEALKPKILDLRKSVNQEINPANLAEKSEVFMTVLEGVDNTLKAQGMAFLRLMQMRSQNENLTSLGLTTANIDRFNVGTPYLGRNAVEPVIGFRRRATIVMQNIRRRLFPTYKERTRDGEVKQSYRTAIEFCEKHPYKPPNQRMDSQYGGDNPADLQVQLADTLSRSERIHRRETQFEIVHGDGVAQAHAMQGPHKRVGLVNCANKDRYGGSWDVSRGSQEESLFRQSNLSVALEQTVSRLRGQRRNHIPAAGVIVNPGVTFMDPTSKDKTFTCDVVSVAAVDYRKRKTGQRAEILEAAKLAGVTPEEFMKQVTKNKYAALFGAFLENGNTDLLISLPGLGAFQNDRQMVMEILDELLIRDGAPFKNMFQSVAFNVFRPDDPTVAALNGVLPRRNA